MGDARRRTAMVGALTAGLALATTVNASAALAQGTAPCPSYYYCFYDNANYTGWHLDYNSTTFGNFGNPPYSDGTDKRDELSSVINNGNRTICVYNNGVIMFRVAPYQDKSYVGDSYNDRADYWKTFSGSVTCPSS